jgi:hypothetical protein
MHTEGHDMGKPEGVPAHPVPQIDAEHPGYETQDVNVVGIVYFLGGLMGFLVVFFGLCFYMGKVINYSFAKEDGEATKWHTPSMIGASPGPRGTREDLTSNPTMYQRELQQVAQSFPTPRLATDDDNQQTADMHAREDLLLENYSSDTAGTTTTLRIPIDRAMELIAQRGLGAAPAAAQKPTMAGDKTPVIQAPLTTGFARTGYELDTIEKREQQNSYKSAEAKTHE